MSIDLSIPDHIWWHESWAEFEDFVNIGKDRTRQLVAYLTQIGESEYIINRLLKANGLPHGPCNTVEAAAGKGA